MGTEKLKFKLELFATMWDKPPHVEISVTNELCFKGDIEGTETKPNIIEFERDLEENKTHNLILNRLGKTNMQTVVNEKGDIFKSVTEIGHNGIWNFEFKSPFYMWLLENLY